MRLLHRRHLLLLCLLSGCLGPSGLHDRANRSTVFKEFDGERRQEHAAAFEQVWRNWHRYGVTVTPPGHRFAHYSLTGELDEERRTALLEVMRDELTALLDATGATWSGTWQPATDRPALIVGQLLGPDMTAVEGSWTTYTSDGQEGWAEVLCARPAGDPEYWTLGCGVHELPSPGS